MFQLRQKNITRSYRKKITRKTRHSNTNSIVTKTRTPTLEHRYVPSPTVDACGTCGGPVTDASMCQMLGLQAYFNAVGTCPWCPTSSSSHGVGSPAGYPCQVRVERHTTTRMILMPWTHSLRFSLISFVFISYVGRVVRTWSTHSNTTHSNTTLQHSGTHRAKTKETYGRTSRCILLASLFSSHCPSHGRRRRYVVQGSYHSVRSGWWRYVYLCCSHDRILWTCHEFLVVLQHRTSFPSCGCSGYALRQITSKNETSESTEQQQPSIWKLLEVLLRFLLRWSFYLYDRTRICRYVWLFRTSSILFHDRQKRMGHMDILSWSLDCSVRLRE